MQKKKTVFPQRLSWLNLIFGGFFGVIMIYQNLNAIGHKEKANEWLRKASLAVIATSLPFMLMGGDGSVLGLLMNIAYIFIFSSYNRTLVLPEVEKHPDHYINAGSKSIGLLILRVLFFSLALGLASVIVTGIE